MPLPRLGLQSKIILIIAVTVMLVVSVSTYIAMWLTRLPVEEEIYRKALAQARLTAGTLADRSILNNQQALLKILSQVEHDFSGVRQADVFMHRAQDRLVATTDPGGAHPELESISDIARY